MKLTSSMLRGGSQLERDFLMRWCSIKNSPDLVREHVFHPGRRWRFDFAHMDSMVAIELEGGIWSGGRHTRGSGFQQDCMKYLEAVLDGWTVVRLTPAMAEDVGTLVRLARFIDGGGVK